MKLHILLFPILILGALFQQFLPGWTLFGGIKPPVLAALALHYALRRNRNEMWLAVFSAALLHDSLEPGPYGPALIAFPVMGVAAHRIRNEIFADGLVTQLAFGAVMGLFTTFATLLLYALTGQRPTHAGTMLLRLFGSIWLGMATFPIVCRSINKLEASLPKRRGYGWQ